MTAQKKSSKKKSTKATKTKSTKTTKADDWTDVERAAMKARAKEMKAEARRGAKRAAGEKELLAALAAMPQPDRGMGERLHVIVTENAPDLMPKTWYGMPAWANADGKVVCFFQGASKFETRYSAFGFNDSANLDDGSMWPTSFALKKLVAADEKRLAALVRKAVG